MKKKLLKKQTPAKKKIVLKRKPKPFQEGELLVSKTGVLFIPMLDRIARGVVLLFPPDPQMHPSDWVRGGQVHDQSVMFNGTRRPTRREVKALRQRMRDRGVSFSFESAGLKVRIPKPEKKVIA